ncbi:PDR/VanB family oxidoreductase [Nocardia sp. NPDC050799]|uniref:PDR/VanB family oxidoreductase n=1 Tax=Nocardia sp. NPDC050799 TaxID=3154842 RepID=UPI003400F0DE
MPFTTRDVETAEGRTSNARPGSELEEAPAMGVSDVTTGATAADALRVAEKTPIADGVIRVKLRHPLGDRLADWTPGSHIDLHLPNGLVRQYSLCGDRWDPLTYEIAVRLDVGGQGGSAYLHDTLEVGDLVAVGGPRNNFRLVPAAEYLFLAGGIGITPLLPMIEAVERMELPYRLLYTGRTRRSMAMADELAERGPHVELYASEEGRRLDLSAAYRDAVRIPVYACGPQSFLDELQSAAVGRDDAHLLKMERFQAVVLSAPARATSFRIRLVRRGVEIDVVPEKSILEVVQEAGVPVLSSCGMGVCGTCETAVISGRPDHRDSLLDEAERADNSCMFICVSRSIDDHLTLDL